MTKHYFSSKIARKLHILIFLTLSFWSILYYSLFITCGFDEPDGCIPSTTLASYTREFLGGFATWRSADVLQPPLKADTHYPYIRPVRTGRMYGSYVRVHFWHPYLRPVFTARIYGCIFETRIYGPYIRVSKIHPYVRAVHTARSRTYGPYIRAVFTGIAYRPLPASSVAEESQCRRNERKGLSVRGPGRVRGLGRNWMFRLEVVSLLMSVTGASATVMWVWTVRELWTANY